MVLVHVLHALEQPFVQANVVSVFGQDGAHLLSQGVEVVVGFGAEHARKGVRYAAQQVVVVLTLFDVHSCYGVLECGLSWVVEDFVSLFVIASDAFHEGFFVVLGADTVEGHGIVRSIIGLKKGILSFFFLFYFFIHTRMMAIIAANLVKISHIEYYPDAFLTYISHGESLVP